MTALKHFFSEQLTPQTNGSATYASILTRSGTDLLANTTYLLIAEASVNGADANKTYGTRVSTADDSTIAAKSEQIREPMSGSADTGQPYLFVHSFQTDATPADVIFEIAAVAGDSNAQADQISLKLIDLDDLGSANFFETIHADPGEGVEEYPTTQADEFTIAGSSLGTDEFVVWGYQRTHVASFGRNHRIEILSALDASTNATVYTRELEGEDVTDKIVTGFAVRHKASSGTPDFAVQTWKEASQTTASNGGGYGIAIKTSAFESGGILFDYTAGTVSVTTSDTILATLTSYSPGTTADHVFYGEFNTQDVSGPDCTLHIEDDGVDHRVGDESTFTRDNSDSTNQPSQTLAYGANILSSDTSTYTLRAKARSATTVGEHRWLIIMTMELATGAQTITGSLLARSPTFPTGAANPGNVTLTGVLLTRSPTFPTGAVNATNTLDGVLLARSPTFPTGTVTPGNVDLDGVLLARSPTFPTGAVNATNTLSGVLLSRSPTFPIGTISSEITIVGTLLARSPTFPTGAANPGNVTIGGSLLARSPTFPTGTITLASGPQTITGILLARSPTFPTGSVDATNTLDGVLLARSPTFPTGAVNATNTLSGILLSRSPTFPIGAVTPGNVTIVGLLLARSPTFPTGAANATNTIVGLLLARSPTFPTGAANATNTITGTLLSRSPTFLTGTVSSVITITGLLLSRSPTFPTGSVDQGETINGILLARSPTFPIGILIFTHPGASLSRGTGPRVASQGTGRRPVLAGSSRPW